MNAVQAENVKYVIKKERKNVKTKMVPTLPDSAYQQRVHNLQTTRPDMKQDCQVKRFYDTEFEAEVAAAKSAALFGTGMLAYKCPNGNHWHVANEVREMRSKYRQYNKMYCELCGIYVKSKNYEKHTRRPGHLARLKREEASNETSLPG